MTLFCKRFQVLDVRSLPDRANDVNFGLLYELPDLLQSNPSVCSGDDKHSFLICRQQLRDFADMTVHADNRCRGRLR